MSVILVFFKLALGDLLTFNAIDVETFLGCPWLIKSFSNIILIRYQISFIHFIRFTELIHPSSNV